MGNFNDYTRVLEVLIFTQNYPVDLYPAYLFQASFLIRYSIYKFLNVTKIKLEVFKTFKRANLFHLNIIKYHFVFFHKNQVSTHRRICPTAERVPKFFGVSTLDLVFITIHQQPIPHFYYSGIGNISKCLQGPKHIICCP